jgi:hypothetical protein
VGCNEQAAAIMSHRSVTDELLFTSSTARVTLLFSDLNNFGGERVIAGEHTAWQSQGRESGAWRSFLTAPSR